jgi:hypothetical protein
VLLEDLLRSPGVLPIVHRQDEARPGVLALLLLQAMQLGQ